MIAAYYDSNYLFKLQCEEAGSEAVRQHAYQLDTIVCSLHGKAEFVSAAHRKVREGTATKSDLGLLIQQLSLDTEAGGIIWLPIDEKLMDRIEQVYQAASSETYLRAADALHLASAAEQGFREIYSNDKHLLKAAPRFGLTGVNVIS